MNSNISNRKIGRIENGGIHELIMIVLSAFMLVSNTIGFVMAWLNFGIGGIPFRTWVWFLLSCFVFWFFTSQHIKMHKYRLKEKLNEANNTSGCGNTADK